MPDPENPTGDPIPARRKEWAGMAVGLLTALMALGWLFGLADRVIMPLIVHSGLERPVPDLYNLPYATADSLCRARGFEVVMTRRRSDPRSAPGNVLDQFPSSGFMVKPGKLVEVVVCENSGPTLCPDVVGKSPQEAAVVAANCGMEVVEEHTVSRTSWNYPAGVIISQSPTSDKPVTPGAELRLTVSLGPPPDQAIVPNIVGLKSSDAETILSKVGLKLGTATTVADSSKEPGAIVTQDPPAGAAVGLGVSIATGIAATGK